MQPDMERHSREESGEWGLPSPKKRNFLEGGKYVCPLLKIGGSPPNLAITTMSVLCTPLQRDIFAPEALSSSPLLEGMSCQSSLKKSFKIQ